MLQPLLAYADRTHPKRQTLRKRRRRGRVSVYFSFFSLLSSLISSLMLISGACLQKSFWWLIWSQSLLSLLCVSPLCCKNILHCLHQPAGGSTALRQSDGKRDHKPSKRGFSCWMKTIREEQEHTHTHTHTHTAHPPLQYKTSFNRLLRLLQEINNRLLYRIQKERKQKWFREVCVCLQELQTAFRGWTVKSKTPKI